MKLGIIGSRSRNTLEDLSLVEEAFIEIKNNWNNDLTIISGGCPKGGDKFAEILAKKYDIPIKIFPANWNLGRHAGFLRNTDIAKESDMLLACVSSNRIGGTEDTIKKFKLFHPKGKIILV